MKTRPEDGYVTVFRVAGIGRKSLHAATLPELSALWCAFRDSEGFGNSAILCGGVVTGPVADGLGECAYLTYNGKVWRSSESWRTEAPLFDPYA